MRKLEGNSSQTSNNIQELEIIGVNKKTKIEDEALSEGESNVSDEFQEDQDGSDDERRSNGIYNIRDGDSMYNEENSDSDSESFDDKDDYSIESIESEGYPSDSDGKVNKKDSLEEKDRTSWNPKDVNSDHFRRWVDACLWLKKCREHEGKEILRK